MKPLRCTLRVLLSSSLLSMLLASCEGRTKSPDPPASRASNLKLISDEQHGSGTRGFIFLPPIVPPPPDYGDFVPRLPVSVRIDELTPDMTILRTLATFTSRSGPGRERLRVHYQGLPCDSDDTDGDTEPRGYYYVRWFTNDAHLTPSATYRIRVFVPAKGGQTKELGYSDVQVVTTMRAYRTTDRQQFTPLLRGTTLRIKFRVAWQAVDADHDGVYDWADNCPAVPNSSQTDSLGNGVGDSCRCAHVMCTAADPCHLAGECQPETGTCTTPLAADGTGCPLHEASGRCSGGQCQFVGCLPGFADCNGDLGDGCETSTTTVANCGACGVACWAGPNSTSTCRDGQCALDCTQGYADCDGDPATGCERHTAADPDHCGACGHVCANHEGCSAGGCSTIVCQGSYGDCNHDTSDGCETALTNDIGNCGNCAFACNLPNATPGCVGGSCVVQACQPGFGDCNQTHIDGCETDLGVDPLNCGSCGNLCSFPKASAECSQGACQMATCNPGYADCDGLASTGCEVDLRSDRQHCGACGNACVLSNASSDCASSACVFGACMPGYANCNGEGTDGCETSLSNDAANCGACGRTCPAGPHSGPICTAGACAIACETGYADCDGDPNNGCETYVEDQCGVCACSLPNTESECIDGVCSFSVCQLGYADCDGIVANGCEVNLAQSCGSCPPACDDGDQCTDDICDPVLGCRHVRTQDDNWTGWCEADPCGVVSCQGAPTSPTCTSSKFPEGAACYPHYFGRDNHCYTQGSCQDGMCQGATRIVCEPPQPCWHSFCDDNMGQCASYPFFPNEPCDVTCPPSSRECYSNVFNRSTGVCEEQPIGGVKSCGAGPCMQTGTCQFGFCHNNFAIHCAEDDRCVKDMPLVCIDGRNCMGRPPLPVGTSCGNGNPCDGDETCDAAGICIGGTPLPDGTSCGGVGLTCQNRVCQ